MRITCSCGGKIIPIKARLRERIGCPSQCGGIVLEKVVGEKCTKCGKSNLIKPI